LYAFGITLTAQLILQVIPSFTNHQLD